MFRILIVEDDVDILGQIEAHLADQIPEAGPIIATTVELGQQLIEQSVEKNELYDVAVLDFKLPQRVGEDPDVDETLCQTIKRKMPETLVIHITSYPGDPRIRQHIVDFHFGRKAPRAALVDKGPRGWIQALLNELKAHHYGTRIEEQMIELFGDKETSVAASRPIARRATVTGGVSLTHRLAALKRDISEHWEDVDESVKDRIQKVFGVNVSNGRVRVSLL